MLLQVKIPRLLISSVAVIIGGWIAGLIIQGITIRTRMRRMKSRGIAIMEPHSLIFGHLPALMELKRGLPKDAHSAYLNARIVQNWKKYFPGASEVPGLVYLDIWPLMAHPICMVVSPDLCAQLTQESRLPRHPMVSWSLTPVTGGLDLISANLADHDTWRSRLNPGFSARNLFDNFPSVMEETALFAQRLKDAAGDDGSWGDMFALYERAVALTFDVIMNYALGIRVHEQTEGPGPLLKSLRSLIPYANMRTINNRLERLTPGFKRNVSRHTRIMDDILIPNIRDRLAVSDKHRKTVVDLAIREVRDSNQQPAAEFIETVNSNLKIFLFAGHDTTAQTICWVYWFISQNPEVLAALRAEHDKVLGKDATVARAILEQDPHKMNDLRYTTAVIRETLRLHPLGSAFRESRPGFEFVSGNLRYPTYDWLIQTAPTMLHVRPDLWPRAAEFLPERFMVPEDDPLHPAKNSWRSFEHGPMRCIGEGLAMMEMTLALALTVRELDFDHNYSLWDQMHTERNGTIPPSVNGQRAYRTGDGIGMIKDDLPTRVRMRAQSPSH